MDKNIFEFIKRVCQENDLTIHYYDELENAYFEIKEHDYSIIINDSEIDKFLLKEFGRYFISDFVIKDDDLFFEVCSYNTDFVLDCYAYFVCNLDYTGLREIDLKYFKAVKNKVEMLLNKGEN